jgi:HEAT repeat protein
MRRGFVVIALAALAAPALAGDATTRQGKTLPAWVEELAAKDAKARVRACQVLGDWGRKGGEAVGPLVKTLGDKDANVRYAAADALGRIGPPAKEAVASLLKLVKDDTDPGVRQAALAALGGIGPSAAEALPEVLALATGRDTPLAILALRALSGLGQSNAEVVAALKKAAKDGDAYVRLEALRTWAEVVEAKDSDAGALAAALGDEDLEVRLAAVQACRRLHPDSPEIQKALLKLLRAAEPEVRRAAVGAIALDAKAIDALRPLLTDPDALVRVAAIAAPVFHPFDKEPAAGTDVFPEALKVLDKALADDDYGVRYEAAVVLEKFARVKPAEVAPLLQKSLSDSNPAVRRAAAVGLLAAKTETAAALKTLDALLADPSATVRGQAALALGYLGDGELAGRLTKLLDDKQPLEVRVRAAAALHRLKKDEAAEKVLLEALAGSDAGLRNLALNAFADRAPPAAAAEVLKSLTLEPSPGVCRKARAILQQLKALPPKTAP